MTEQAKVPAIRFAGFTDPWEQRKLGDIAERVTRKNENNESDLPLTISAQHGLIDQRLFFNAQVASRDMSGYYLLRQGEFAYNKSTSADSPWGAIKRLTRYEKGCVSTLYICFALLNANPDYLVTYYETNRWHKAVQMIAAEGARNHGLLNIAPDDFFDTMVSLPESQAEQQTIGAFFSRLDSLITLHQRKYDKLVIFKKSMLEKMFPKDGESVPEIRFAGFTDPWEQRKFSELASLRRGLTYSPADIRPYGQGIRVLRSSNIDEDEFTLSNEDVFVDETVVGIELVQEGEILITAANGSPRLVGKRAIINGLTGKTVHGGFMLCAHAEQPDYVAALMGSRWYQHFLATGVAGGNGSIGNLDKAALEDEFAFVPSIEEQELIGVLFSRLDDLITLHQRKLELLQNIKKSLLDKMFV